MANAEGGSVPSGVGVWGEVSPLQERRELPQLGPGQSPGRKRILTYFEGHIRSFLYLYDKFWVWTICISVPTPNSGGLVPRPFPCDLRHGSNCR